MAGWRRPEQIIKSQPRPLRPGVEVVKAEGREIDQGDQKVKTSDDDLAYDCLVVVAGANLAPEMAAGRGSKLRCP